MKGLSKEVREIMKEYIGDNSVAGVTVLAVTLSLSLTYPISVYVLLHCPNTSK